MLYNRRILNFKFISKINKYIQYIEYLYIECQNVIIYNFMIPWYTHLKSSFFLRRFMLFSVLLCIAISLLKLKLFPVLTHRNKNGANSVFIFMNNRQ